MLLPVFLIMVLPAVWFGKIFGLSHIESSSAIIVAILLGYFTGRVDLTEREYKICKKFESLFSHKKGNKTLGKRVE